MPDMKSSVIIPALNEEESLGYVLASIPMDLIAEIIVVDGGSTDNTVSIAEAAGARVIREPRRGYGRACATGVEHANGEILIFLDADGADDPTDIQALVEPLKAEEAEIVLGSRLAGELETNAMPWQQYFGNRLSAWLIRLLYRLPVTDLSPFRAVRKSKLMELGMTEMTYGWPTEMIVKAARQGWRIREIPVRYRSRYGGTSKISGTLRGTVLATYHIISTILRYALSAEEKNDTKASPNQKLS
jgi:glycosyltransferase involved in cell wall biosynthesis